MTDRSFSMGADMPVLEPVVVAAAPDWQARLRDDPDQFAPMRSWLAKTREPTGAGSPVR